MSFAEVQTHFTSNLQVKTSSIVRQAIDLASRIDQLAQESFPNDTVPIAGHFIRGAPVFEATALRETLSLGRFSPQWLIRRRLAAFALNVGKERLTSDVANFVECVESWLCGCVAELREALLQFEGQDGLNTAAIRAKALWATLS